MEDYNRHSRRKRDLYNEDWDLHADRDRYERDYYQNRRYRPQGYSYDADRDMYGTADYNRYGTGYAGNDYERYSDYDRHGQRAGSGHRPEDADWNRREIPHYNRRGERFGDAGFNHDYDYDRTRYGYPENRNADHFGRGRRSDYYNPNRNEWTRPHDNDRDWWDRTGDEVASWFGDEEAERRRERDKRNDHRGKGPKGYKRSDEKIKSELEDELYNDSYIDASDMEVTVNDAEVTLTGSVESKWIKRRAEDLAETITGVEVVKNHLIVRKEPQRNPADYYSNAETGAKATSGTGRMTTNTDHKTGNTQKAKG